jgi:hypothetical protein
LGWCAPAARDTLCELEGRAMEPEPFCVRGVVKDGQVVLSVALPLPDGATVYVATEPPDQISRIGLPGPMPEHEIKKLILALARRPMALVHKLPVYTANPGRYANLPGLAAIQPY